MTSPALTFERSRPEDRDAVLALYKAAAASEGGLARTPDEITSAYVDGFLAKADARGLGLIAWTPDGQAAGEIHVFHMDPAQFAHVLTDLTVAVHPDWQGKGVGSVLFKALIANARLLTPKIERIELGAREGNAGAIRLYQRLGFQIEGRFVGRVRMPDGTTEDDIPMALRL